MPQNPTFFTLAQVIGSSTQSGTGAPAAVETPKDPAALPANPAAPEAGTSGNTTITTASTAPAGATSKPKEAPSIFSGIFLPLTLMLVLLYFVLFRGQRKEEKKRKAMVAEMKKGDKVMTIGGMVARVVSIEGDEVTLKIDESANVKAVYLKSAIQKVINADDSKAK